MSYRQQRANGQFCNRDLDVISETPLSDSCIAFVGAVRGDSSWPESPAPLEVTQSSP